MDAAFSSKEQEALAEFRKNVEDVLTPAHDDDFLIRWLRAREMKLDDAEAMLRKSLEWRKNGQIDSILEWYRPTEVLQKYWPTGYSGYDKEGRPILFFRFGNLDMRGMVYSAKTSDVCIHIAHLLERGSALMRSQSKKLGRVINQLVVLLDLDNFSFYQIAWTPAFHVMSSLVKLYEAHFPEQLKQVYAINTPMIFHVAFSLLKPFFSEKTYKKFLLIPRDAWKPTLFNVIDEDQLPAYLGGTKVGPDGDIYCTHLIPGGGKIPESYYATECTLSNEEGATSISISPGSSYTVEIIVNQPGSVLNWEFRTLSYSIAYGLYLKTEEQMKEIIPIGRVKCSVFPESGSLYCEERGTYLLKFDNSFSWRKPKTVVYFTEVASVKKE